METLSISEIGQLPKRFALLVINGSAAKANGTAR